MAAGGRLTGDSLASPSEPLEWRVAPWRREPKKALFAVVVVAAGVVGSIWFSGGIWFFGLLALLILSGSVGPFFVNSRFVLDDGGVEVDSPFMRRRRAWPEIKSYYVDRRGATLSPFVGRSWLESYRAIRLLFGDREEAVRARLRERLGEPAR
ncbi:MAG: hypothetical protein SGI90_12075 [Candidatus Eisenbacteria bacterium]|nr:hypothetical protein [Candidatus Eisenbacteria bacterium]